MTAPLHGYGEHYIEGILQKYYSIVSDRKTNWHIMIMGTWGI